MREFKFRAWFEVHKIMVQHENLSIDYGKNEGFNMAYDHSLDLATFAFIPMQYTGLKDKNGKEIYQGDIMRTGDDDNFFLEVVEWDYFNAGWVFTSSDQGKWFPASKRLDSFEVIGNIYENPELIP